MQLGIVSNCWQHQLSEGVPIDDLIAQASRLGYQAIELRQGSLGRYETGGGGEQLPIAESLAEFPKKFPGIRFNIAVAVPFLNPETTASHKVIEAGKWAAQAVAGETPPHLRLVDLTTTGDQLAAIGTENAADAIVRLTESVIEMDGLLSVEHSLQPWELFYGAFHSARRRLAGNKSRLKLCFDPVNLLLPNTKADPNEVTAALSVDELFMVHFKQRFQNQTLSTVTEGDIDWGTQISLLKEKHYAGSWLFEIAADRNVWSHLTASIGYLQRQGLEVIGETGDGG